MVPADRPPVRLLLLLGALSGALAAGGAERLRTSLVPERSVRVPAAFVLDGRAPDALAYAAGEAGRLRRVQAGARAWPPPPLGPVDRAPVADEGVLRLLPGGRLALAWVTLPGASDERALVVAWRRAEVALAPWDGDPRGVLAWMGAPPATEAVARVVAALGSPPPPSPAPTPRGAAERVLGLCVDGAGTAWLLHGDGARPGAARALLAAHGCGAPGAVWRSRDPDARLRFGLPPRPGVWVLRARPAPAEARAPRGRQAPPVRG